MAEGIFSIEYWKYRLGTLIRFTPIFLFTHFHIVVLENVLIVFTVFLYFLCSLILLNVVICILVVTKVVIRLENIVFINCKDVILVLLHINLQIIYDFFARQFFIQVLIIQKILNITHWVFTTEIILLVYKT
jgi:hypothetical protein